MKLCFNVKIHLKLCFDKKIQLKLCFDVKIHLKLCFEDEIHLKLCFDMKIIWNYVYFSYFFQIKFTFCHEIQKIDFNFVFWQVKSNKFICIWVLTEKIQQNDLNFCFDMKIQINLFEFVFWQRKSIWSIFTGYILNFFKSNLLFDRKNPENWVEFCFLTGKI